MKIKINKNGYISLIMFIYVIFAALCINNIKAITFLVLLLIGFPIIFKNLRKINIISFFGFYYPLIVILISSVVSGDLVTSFKRTYCCFLLLLVILIKYYNIDYKKIFYITVWIITLITVLTYALDIFGIIDINQSNFIKNIIYKYNIGLMGKHESYYFYYSIFLYSSPLMIFLFFKNVSEKKNILSIIVFIGILASGERTPVFLTIFGFFIYEIIYESKSYHKKIMMAIIIFIIMVFVVVFYGEQLWNSIYDIIFIKGNISNNVRGDHIDSLIQLYKQKPLMLLFGSGMGTEFYTSAWGGKVTSDIELSFFNLIRQMGVPLFTLFLYFLIYPLKNIKMERYEKMAYIIYLIVAALNPYLFDSTAYLVYIYMYEFYKNKKYSLKAN